MNKARILILGLALGSAALAGVLAKGVIGKKSVKEVVEVNKVPMVQVLVASKDLALGERLGDAAINWRDWPQDNVGELMITKDSNPDALEKMKMARARLPIFSGEPIVDRKLVMPNEGGFMSAILPQGMRAISVAISERSAVSGFILPNDRVDVILTRKLDGPDGSGKVVRSETVLTNVRVLAINQTFRQEAGEDKVTVTEGKTAVLELDPQQSEVITKVEAAGELSLALRSIAEGGDSGVQDTRPVLSDAFKGSKKSADGDRVIVRYGVETVITSR
ncbi:Flp pilus assembly protein CpaB [Aestuariivirga sp.]|uniref:Flp pilus assembly protein CpaB n=1 Tax=Aestuariivirga sp. TaxID=2650926 RepID=UPI003593D71D